MSQTLSIEKHENGVGVENHEIAIAHTSTMDIDSERMQKAVRKIDYRVIPILTLLYILSFMDRTNIGNAKVAGMNTELNLSGSQYNMALTIFFFPYALFEIPSNIVLKLMRPSIWISILVVTWGTIVTLQGIVKSYEHLLLTRFLTGLSEAGFFPAATYLLTTWYSRWQLQTRMSIFYSAASIAGSFSGLLAFGIQHMEGIAGLAGWRWIFILEGILTVLVGCTIPWALPDSLANAKFLTEEEKQLIKDQLSRDIGFENNSGGEHGSFEWKYLKQALLDWKIYLGIVIFWGNSVSTYGFNFSSPTIIKNLGYTAAQAQLLTIPIYFAGAISTVSFARLADKKKTRWLFIVVPYSIALIGFIAMLAIPHPALPGLTYFFLFFITCGLYPSLIGCIAWIGNNLAPTHKRAMGMALLMTLGNLGGAVGSNIFLEQQTPHYWLGYGFSAGIILAAMISTIVLHFAIKRINQKREQYSVEEIRQRYTDEELIEMGDKSPLFRYAL